MTKSLPSPCILWNCRVTPRGLREAGDDCPPCPDTAPPTRPAPCCAFWFDEVGQERWFAKDAALDAEIRAVRRAARSRLATSDAKGGATRRHAARGDHPARPVQPQHSPRHRPGVRRRCRWRSSWRGWRSHRAGTQRCPRDQRQFLLMPLMHSEEIADQRPIGRPSSPASASRSNSISPASHHDQIERFGRFPGRNAALGRRSRPRRSKRARRWRRLLKLDLAASSA